MLIFRKKAKQCFKTPNGITFIYKSNICVEPCCLAGYKYKQKMKRKWSVFFIICFGFQMKKIKSEKMLWLDVQVIIKINQFNVHCHTH